MTTASKTKRSAGARVLAKQSRPLRLRELLDGKGTEEQRKQVANDFRKAADALAAVDLADAERRIAKMYLWLANTSEHMRSTATEEFTLPELEQAYEQAYESVVQQLATNAAKRSHDWEGQLHEGIVALYKDNLELAPTPPSTAAKELEVGKALVPKVTILLQKLDLQFPATTTKRRAKWNPDDPGSLAQRIATFFKSRALFPKRKRGPQS